MAYAESGDEPACGDRIARSQRHESTRLSASLQRIGDRPGRDYMFSRSDGIVLGGTHGEGVWSLEPDLVRKQQILAGHQALFDGFRRCRASA